MNDLAVQLDAAELGDLHTCRGPGTSPRIRLGPLDQRVRSLAVVVIDPFEPGCSFALWIAAGILPVPVIPAGLAADGTGPVPSIQGTGDSGRRGWQPPCPRAGDPPHQLTVKVYALDDAPSLPPGFSRAALNEALRGRILQFGATIAFVRQGRHQVYPLAGAVLTRGTIMNPLTVRLPISHFPPNYTCDGADISPALEIHGYDDTVRTIAIVVNDPDSRGGTFVHWLCWNMEVVTTVPENIPKEPEITFPVAARQGTNDFGRIGYGGPCPPRGQTHRYAFKVYALDGQLDLSPGSGLPELAAAMRGRILQFGEAQATYGR